MNLQPNHIRRFYVKRFEENDLFHSWPQLWMKQYKLRLHDNTFLKLNQRRERLDYPSLKRYAIHYAPVNIYMSLLNWLMPERVAEKSKANRAYPIGGEYVIDVDSHLFWRPHYHRNTEEGICYGCLHRSKDITLNLLFKVMENYSDIMVVFSGRKGFHLHVLDFELRDWTHYNDRDPIKSHEVARFLYTKHIKSGFGGFDDPHFTLSSDPMRVITFPRSLNGRTGLLCHAMTGREFLNITLSEVLMRAHIKKSVFFPADWTPLNHAHLEPHISARR